MTRLELDWHSPRSLCPKPPTPRDHIVPSLTPSCPRNWGNGDSSSNSSGEAATDTKKGCRLAGDTRWKIVKSARYCDGSTVIFRPEAAIFKFAPFVSLFRLMTTPLLFLSDE